MDANNHTFIWGSNTTNMDDNESVNHSQTQQNSVTTKDTMRTAKIHKKWNRRLKFFFCCLGYKKNKDSFADVASIFADFFSDLDSSSSEIVAGFVTLAKFQKAQREWNVNNKKDDIYQYLSCLPISPNTKFLDVSEASDSHLVNELIYYMNYSLAIFGWPMQMIDDPCMLCCIYPYLRVSPCCSGKRRQNKTKDDDKGKKGVKNLNTRDQNNIDLAAAATNSTSNPSGHSGNNPTKTGKLAEDCDTPIIIDDNCCNCNAASVERRLAAHNYEIIYITYHVDVSRVPFLVAADHSKQSIVVAMRGSMSLDDVVTDMNGQIDRVPIKDCPDDWLCHRGISRAANYIKTKLVEEGILYKAFNCRPDLGSQDYNLILCGHSLGAGAAAILGILLRVQYPHLKAYLYSPPGGILSLPVVEYTKKFAIGIILGNDCVPRLGVAQFERLRYHVFLSLKNAQQSPSKILTKTFCPCCCSKKTKIEYDPNASVDLLYGLNGRSFDYKGIKIPFQVQPCLLYVPGRILHIVKNYSLQSRASRLFKGPLYQAIWVENTDYDRIMIANGMFCDHLPNNLMHAMKMLFVNTLPVRKSSKLSDHNYNITTCANEKTDSSNNTSLVKQPNEVYDNQDHTERKNVICEQQKIILDDNNNDASSIVDDDTKAFKDNNNNSNKSNIRGTEEIIVNFDKNGNDENTYNRNYVQLDYEPYIGNTGELSQLNKFKKEDKKKDDTS